MIIPNNTPYYASNKEASIKYIKKFLNWADILFEAITNTVYINNFQEFIYYI